MRTTTTKKKINDMIQTISVCHVLVWSPSAERAWLTPPVDPGRPVAFVCVLGLSQASGIFCWLHRLDYFSSLPGREELFT